jgi:ClpX C4-type zinc finger
MTDATDMQKMKPKLTCVELVPPPAIGTDRVILYAIADRSVKYTKKQRLYVGDKLLGRVPRIAICKSLRKDIKEHLILFCNNKWQPLGVSGAKTLSAAKRQVDRYYLGISEKWLPVNASVQDAKRWLADHYPLDVCSFCGKFSYEVDAMFPSRTSVICASCVELFANKLKLREKL